MLLPLWWDEQSDSDMRKIKNVGSFSAQTVTLRAGACPGNPGSQVPPDPPRKRGVLRYRSTTPGTLPFRLLEFTAIWVAAPKAFHVFAGTIFATLAPGLM